MKGPCDHLQNWASLPLSPPWEETGFTLYGERMVTRTCPGEWTATPSFRTKGLDCGHKGSILRWQQDGYRLSTFQYEAETLLWRGDEWRLPLPDELDELLGYPRGYTAVAGATDLQREQLLGNTMHVAAAVVRLLEDLKDGTPVSRTKDEDEDGADPGGQHQVVSVDTSNILQETHNCCHVLCISQQLFSLAVCGTRYRCVASGVPQQFVQFVWER